MKKLQVLGILGTVNLAGNNSNLKNLFKSIHYNSLFNL